MKKVLVICLAMLMVVGMSVNAFAASNAFVSSPSKNPAPELIEGINESEDCTGNAFITSYGDRDSLSEEDRKQIEKAYEDILATTDLTTINSDLKELASNLNVNAANLSVSDLFNIGHENCDDHDSHGDFTVTINAEMLDRFVGLLYYSNGKWELIKDVKIENVNGEMQLKFASEGVSSYAIVVDTTEAQGVSPETGDNSRIHIYMIVMAVSALAIVLVSLKSKKQAA